MTLLNELNSICADLSLILKSPAFSVLPEIKPNGTRIDIFLKNPPDKIRARDKILIANDAIALAAYDRLTAKTIANNYKQDAFLFFYKVFGSINLTHKMCFSPEFKWNTQSFVNSSFETAIKSCISHGNQLGSKFFNEFTSCQSNWPRRWHHEYENIAITFIGLANAAYLFTNGSLNHSGKPATWHKDKKDFQNDTYGFFCDFYNFKDILNIIKNTYDPKNYEQNAFILQVRDRWINWQSIIERRNLVDSFAAQTAPTNNNTKAL